MGKQEKIAEHRLYVPMKEKPSTLFTGLSVLFMGFCMTPS